MKRGFGVGLGSHPCLSPCTSTCTCQQRVVVRRCQQRLLISRQSSSLQLLPIDKCSEDSTAGEDSLASEVRRLQCFDRSFYSSARMSSRDAPAATPNDGDIPGGWPARRSMHADDPNSLQYVQLDGSASESRTDESHDEAERPLSPENSIRLVSSGSRYSQPELLHPEVAYGPGIETPPNRFSTFSEQSSQRVSTYSDVASWRAPTQRWSRQSILSQDNGHSQNGSQNGNGRSAPSVYASRETQTTPTLRERPSQRILNEDDAIRVLRTKRSNVSSLGVSRASTEEDEEERAEINRLMSKMFGRTRQEQSEEERTRHVGVVFKNLTVKGMGSGAALQPTFGDPFLGLPRLLKRLLTRGRGAIGKPPTKTIINNFSGVIKPGEMCLVLGRPGSGCSTFLKVLGNQRFGYESVDGEVLYGGTDAHTMLKKYRGEVLYNPEDDLHYATISVKATLKFALKCKTPGKESRNEGESASAYVKNFLQAVVKLFWIEHTLDTKVGNEYVRGVSGGEKKRVSIAEAMITKASIQCWDNSTRGLDASTALEYVMSLRSLTNYAHISTAVALYQAGENLYNKFDKVLLIDKGRCAFFGSTDDAASYFQDLGFVQPPRWTSADFLTSVTDEHERHVKDGWEHRIPRSAQEFGDIFLESQQHQRNLDEIQEFEMEMQAQIEERQQARGKATRRKNYTIAFYKQVLACTHRQFLVMIGDKQSLGGKWGGVLFQALIVGSLFYNLPAASPGVFPRGGVLFFTLLFNALLALAELTVGRHQHQQSLDMTDIVFRLPSNADQFSSSTSHFNSTGPLPSPLHRPWSTFRLCSYRSPSLTLWSTSCRTSLARHLNSSSVCWLFG